MGPGNRPRSLKEVIPISEQKETPQERYHKAHTKLLTIRLVDNTEQDIIQRLDSVPNKAGYIKSLIRADIAKENRSYSSMTAKQRKAYDSFKSLSGNKPSE